MGAPLEGVRVVDFCRVLAGPLCAKMLRDLGAEVIKVEPPSPDVSRWAFPRTEYMSGYYAQQNAGKRNVSLDLNRQEGREIAMRLCATADVIVENFRAGTLAGFGLDYDSVAKNNPAVVYVSITGYGTDGPWASRMAYAPTVQAETGFLANSLRHYGGSLAEPRTDALSHADLYTGLEAAIAVLAALRARERTGAGDHVDVSMAATMLVVNERLHADMSGEDLGAEPAALGAGDIPFFDGPAGERLVTGASLVGSLTFRLFVMAMRRPDLLSDARFRTAEDRRANLGELHALVQAWIRSFDSLASLDAQLDEAKIAIGQIRSLADLAKTEWARHWGAFREVRDRAGGTVRVPGTPWRFKHAALPGPGMPALQGEDNADVLAELGYGPAAQHALLASGTMSGPKPPPPGDPAVTGDRQNQGAQPPADVDGTAGKAGIAPSNVLPAPAHSTTTRDSPQQAGEALL